MLWSHMIILQNYIWTVQNNRTLQKPTHTTLLTQVQKPYHPLFRFSFFTSPLQWARRLHENGVRFRDLREKSGGGRQAPHARSSCLRFGQGALERPEGRRRPVRGDLYLRWAC